MRVSAQHEQRIQERRAMRLTRLLAWSSILASVAGTACGRARHESPPVPTLALGSGPDAPVASTFTPPLESTPPIVPLSVPGFPDAVVSVPIGAVSPRPVVVVTHGLWDLPEGICDNWRWIVRDRAWVLCPRGTPMPDNTFRYKSGPALAREIDAGLHALEERYPGYVDDGPMLYSGFSLGAILGVWIVTHDPARYPRAVLTEGGEDRFDGATAATYARGGGQRVLFACGLRARVPSATRAAHTSNARACRRAWSSASSPTRANSSTGTTVRSPRRRRPSSSGSSRATRAGHREPREGGPPADVERRGIDRLSA